MGWANKLIGWASGNGAEVDAGNNLRTTHPQVNQRLGGETPAPNYVGGVKMFCENDPGSVTGSISSTQEVGRVGISGVVTQPVIKEEGEDEIIMLMFLMAA